MTPPFGPRRPTPDERPRTDPGEGGVRVAVMTMTRDEADMLPRWLDYYGGHFGLDSLVVIDDGTTDGSTDGLGCTVLRTPPGPWKQSWMQTRVDLVNGLSRGLLACFDVVVFTDVDEFLVPDPDRYADFAAYVAAHPDDEVLAPVAVNVLHRESVEPDFDRERPVLAQRRFVKFVPGMCKPLIKRVPAPWTMGFHGIRTTYRPDPDLLLVHLKYYDAKGLVQVAEARKQLHDDEGRGAAASAWSLGASEIQHQLRQWVQAPDTAGVPVLEPRDLDLDKVVRRLPNGFFRSQGRQLTAMETNPLLELPERFRSAV